MNETIEKLAVEMSSAWTGILSSGGNVAELNRQNVFNRVKESGYREEIMKRSQEIFSGI